MVCCPPSGYIIFSLRNFKFYEGRIWGPGAGSRITQRPHKISMWNTNNISNIDSLWIRIQVIPFNFLLNGLTFAFKARTCGNLYEGVHFTKTSLRAKLTSGPIHQHHQFLVEILRAVTQKKKWNFFPEQSLSYKLCIQKSRENTMENYMSLSPYL